MPTYKGTVAKDNTAVHSTATKEGGNKIGKPLKKGDTFTGDTLENGWMHITAPMKGWVFATDLVYPDPDAIVTPPPVVDTHTTETSTTSAPPATTVVPTNSTPAVTSGSVYKVRKWGDATMKKYSFTLDAFPPDLGSNFQAVPLYDAGGNGGSTVSFVRINQKQIAHLKSLQSDADGFKIEKKLQWLSEQKGKRHGKGSAYMWDDDQGDLNDKNTTSILWQAIIYGGQPVVVLDTLPLEVDLPDHPRQTVEVARILLYDMDNPDERAIQQATAVRGHGKDEYNPTPNGMVIRAPIWKGKYQYIPTAWLES